MAEVPIEYFLTEQSIRLLSSLVDETEPITDILPEGMSNADILSLMMSVTAAAVLILQALPAGKCRMVLDELASNAK